jgi:hypothetical protein
VHAFLGPDDILLFFLLAARHWTRAGMPPTLLGGQPASARPSLADPADVLPTEGSGYLTLPGRPTSDCTAMPPATGPGASSGRDAAHVHSSPAPKA